MRGKFALLGVVLTAVGLLSGIAASSALAVSSQDVGANPAILTATQVEPLKLTIGTAGNRTVFKCTTATLEATVTSTSITEEVFTPTDAGCTLGGLAATLDVNGCKFKVTNTTTEKTWKMDISGCTNAEKKMEITQGTCEIEIKEQLSLSSLTQKTEGAAPTDVLETAAVTGIVTTGTAGCPANLRGELKTGEYTGTTTMKAFVDNAGVEGAQVNLSAT